MRAGLLCNRRSTTSTSRALHTASLFQTLTVSMQVTIPAGFSTGKGLRFDFEGEYYRAVYQGPFCDKSQTYARHLPLFRGPGSHPSSLAGKQAATRGRESGPAS